MDKFIFQNANCEDIDCRYPSNILASVERIDDIFFFHPVDNRLDTLKINKEDLIILAECLQYELSQDEDNKKADFII